VRAHLAAARVPTDRRGSVAALEVKGDTIVGRGNGTILAMVASFRDARSCVAWLIFGIGGCFAIDPVDDCRDIGVEVVDGDAPVPALGFSAVPVRDLALGTHEVDVFWRSTDSVVYAPGPGVSVLTVEVRDAGEVRYVESKRDGDESSTDDEDGCPDRLEIDATVRLGTADGALDEELELAIAAVRPEIVSLEGVLELDTLGGDFRVQSQPPDSDVGPLGLDLAIGSEGMFGSIELPLTVRRGDGVAHTELVLARFPDEEPVCEFGVPVAFAAPLAGITGPDVLAVWAAAAPHALVDASGVASSLAIELGEPPAIVCAGIEDRGPASFDLDLRLTSADGRIDGVFDVLVGPRLDDDGNLEKVGFYRNDYGVRPFPPDELEQRFGITGVDMAAYDSATLDLHGFVASTGVDATLTLHGHRPDATNDEIVVQWTLQPAG